MSGRSTRKKKAPPKLVELEEETSASRSARKKSIQKPRYVLDAERSSTPSSSRRSSPSSRTSSPSPSARPKSKSSSSKKMKTPKSSKGTPGGSRASSVTKSTAGKKSGKKSVNSKTPKLKTKMGRGYNPNLVNYRDSEYHYGSDFEGDHDFEEPESEKSSESEMSEGEEESDELKPESDVELEPVLEDRDSFTPVPLWVQDHMEVPTLNLPPTSEDLPVPPQFALPVVSIYEVLRQFHAIVRLSPFKLEDLCAALASEEHSKLLSEVHMGLLKCLMREDELQQVQYGPLDQKDSMNVFLHFYDTVTWPENLRFYLANDPVANATTLDILETTEYPFTSLENKVTVLQHLTNAVLSTTAVREDIQNEGQLPMEDHCRVCHKLGDMVLCEHCNGPFHGNCLVPPLEDIPEEDWICPVCARHMVEGVYDATMVPPGAARQEDFGLDRNGARYWFLARRLWIEELDGKVSYYSSKEQLEEVMDALDPQSFERELVKALEERRGEMEEHMEITERLTEQAKGGSRKSYLEMENAALARVQESRRAVRAREEVQRRKAQAEVDKLIREEEDGRRKKDEEEKKEAAEAKRKLREERMEERMKKRGDSFQDEELFGDLDSDPILEQVTVGGTEETVSMEEQVLEGDSGEVPVLLEKEPVPPGNYFKLGEEGGFRQYENQYSLVQHALSRNQVLDDAAKRTRLSHKFSLTEASIFSWQGREVGTRGVIVTTLRSTILALEQAIPMCFMHANWPMLKRPWINAVQSCSNAEKDFSRALTVLQCCIKPCILLPVWSDSLGHTNIRRILAQAKEEKKKAEKKEKKERDDEEERLKPWMAWVKYTLPVKSLTVVRQKGEEYRAHGRTGWLWLSSTRRWIPRSSSKLGLKAGPHRVAVKYTELKTSVSKVVLMEPNAFAFLMKVQKERDDKALAKMVSGEDAEEETPEEVKEKTPEEERRAKLTKILDISRIDLQEAGDDALGGVDGVVDVSAGLANPTRQLFPRAAKPTSLDDLLARRLQLKSWEQKKIKLLQQSKVEKVEPEGEKDGKTVITSDMVEQVPETVDHEAWISKAKRQLFDAVKLVRDSTAAVPTGPCYSPACASGDSASCYVASCTARDAQDALTKASTIYQAVCTEGKQKDLVKDIPAEAKVFKSNAEATSSLTQVVKVLLHKEKELSEQTIQAISKPDMESAAIIPKSETSEVKLEDEGAGSPAKSLKRCYSVESPAGSLYLKRIQSVAESKKTSRIVKYPLAPSFWSTSRKKRNILIVNKHDIRRLARNLSLTSQVDGFNYAAKANNVVWPYPCPRPAFKTSWLFRTAAMKSLHSVAMQLRILWMCIRWDDMLTKPPSGDGKNQVTTDHEIVTSEILKHRNQGRYLENTQYFQRKISIPLDQPRKQVDYSPIRSGLRKRKRAESPVNADPRVEEVWIDEADLELWEIKAYRDRLDRERTAVGTRRNTGTTIKAPEKFDPSDMERTKRVLSSSSLQDLKAKTEESMIQQRAAFKAGRSATPEIPALNVRRQGEPKLIAAKGVNSTPNNAKKIFVSKDGKIIGHQVSNAGAAPPGKVAIPNLASKNQPAGAAGTQQKVQIVKSADGKIQAASPIKPGPGAKVLGGGAPLPTQPTLVPSKSTPSQPSLLPKPNIAPSPSPSKTYTIQRNPNVPVTPNMTPIQPKPIAPSPQQLTPAPTPVQTPAATPGTPATPNKQNMVVGIQSLGANTVTIKDGQLIVQGPDHAHATQIAQLLSTGAAKLANLNGKQVLLTTAPAKAGQQSTGATPTAPPPREPTPPPPPREPTPPPPREPSPPPSLTVTAQLAQTPQGPRIILQGLQGVQLEQQQLVAIQQQVKQQLLRQQSIARQQGKVPPTKVTLQLSGPNIRKEEPAVVNPAQVQEPPQAPPAQPQQLAPAPQIVPQQNPGLQTQPGLTTPNKARQTAPNLSTLPESVIKQGHFVVKDGKKVLVLPQAALAAHQASLASPVANTATSSTNQSLLLQSLTSPNRQSPGLPSPTLNTTPLPVAGPDGDKFELTEDYIQQTIKDALKGGNLTPELQEKLMSQLDGDVNMPESLTKQRSRNNSRRRGKGRNSGAMDPASGDDEWQPRLRGKGGSDESSDEDEGYKYRSPPPKVVKKLIPSSGPTDDKKRLTVRNRLTSMLFKQKEQLKKDIAKKRAQLEKELSADIAAEVNSLKQKAQLKLAQQGKRLRDDGDQVIGQQISPARKKRRSTGRSGDGLAGSPSNDSDSSVPGIKKDKLYCICKQKYDATKFYVGCDICSNWFHGSCVNITPRMSKKMSEYVCDECRSAKENDEIYCLCRQPYDESQFYIGCERCSDWFHGRCVGILQAEAKDIDEYVCPKCDPHSKQNYPNLKKLNRADHELIRKTFKAIKQNRHSQQFMEPVDQRENPKYYEIVKEPMDLSIIEARVNRSEYNCLAEFLGDMTRILENCRYFNPPGTRVAAAAEGLEQWLARQMPGVREKVAMQAK